MILLSTASAPSEGLPTAARNESTSWATRPQLPVRLKQLLYMQQSDLIRSAPSQRDPSQPTWPPATAAPQTDLDYDGAAANGAAVDASATLTVHPPLVAAPPPPPPE